MKKFTFILFLLGLLSFQIAAAQQTAVADLAGNYSCLTQGFAASLRFDINGNDVELTFCPNATPEACVTYIEVYPTLVEGKIMSKGVEATDPATDWPDTRFVVDESQAAVRITVYFADGIDYVFERQ